MWKAPLRGFLLVLVVAGVAILSLGLWARFTIYDQDQFVQVVSGLSSDPAVQQAAIERTMAEIDRQIQERTATQALSPTIALTYEMFRPQIEAGIMQALQSPQWQPIWNQALPDNGWTTLPAPSLERHDAGFDPLTGEGGAAIWIPVVGAERSC